MFDSDASRIDKMIETGKSIVNEALYLHRPDAIIAAYSGGNDSIVSTHFADTNYGAVVVHCDTGTGIKKTGQHVKDSAKKFDWTLKVSKAEPEGKPKSGSFVGEPWNDGETAYEEFVLNHGFPGPAQHGRMYQRLKERPLLKIARQLRSGRGRKVLVISGIRHDESAIRAGYKRAIQAPGKTFLVWANPFYYYTAMDFELYRQEFGLPRNPVKARVGISGECLCGAYASEGEKELVRSVEPETAEYLDGLEDRARANGFPWGWGESPPTAWLDSRRGQGFLFPVIEDFQPMCVGCPRKAGKRIA